MYIYIAFLLELLAFVISTQTGEIQLWSSSIIYPLLVSNAIITILFLIRTNQFLWIQYLIFIRFIVIGFTIPIAMFYPHLIYALIIDTSAIYWLWFGSNEFFHI